MPIVSTAKMTANQFLQLGDDPVGVRLELVDGEVAVSPSPNARHSKALVKLLGILDNYVDSHDLGEVLTDLDTVVSAYDVRRPDILFFQKSRLHLINTEQALRNPPDLCVEIVSPSSKVIDRVDKFAQYAESKVAFYWILDPAKKMFEAWQLKGSEYLVAGNGQGDETVAALPFPELRIPLRILWRAE